MTTELPDADKIRALVGLLGSRELRPDDECFIRDLQTFLPPGQTEAMSERQTKRMNGLFDRYCKTTVTA